MPTSRFDLSWRLVVETGDAATLAAALEPETDPEHARLETTDDGLAASGQGDAGACLHTLDDVLACLTGALEALEAQTASNDGA